MFDVGMSCVHMSQGVFDVGVYVIRLNMCLTRAFPLYHCLSAFVVGIFVA